LSEKEVDEKWSANSSIKEKKTPNLGLVSLLTLAGNPCNKP
jgi:hypothetical protein